MKNNTAVDTIISNSPEQTFSLGRDFAKRLRAGDVLALDGDLGAGKTQFIKGLAAGLGHTGEVTSPTFTLVHEYTGGHLPLFHFDFYRLENDDEALRIGLDDYLASTGILAIEWAGKFPGILPKATLRLRFHAGHGDARTIELP
jgi:tRNA threonylcarbamoyladenosine biosynthesis protein TsaE